MAWITIRVSEEEREQLKKTAEAEGMTLSDYVRSRLTGVKPRRKPKTEEVEELRKLAYEIHKIGVNINQIARAMNTALKTAPNERFFSAVEEGIEALHRIEAELKEIGRRLR